MAVAYRVLTNVNTLRALGLPDEEIAKYGTALSGSELIPWVKKARGQQSEP
jgi:hypothetical protein